MISESPPKWTTAGLPWNLFICFPYHLADRVRWTGKHAAERIEWLIHVLSTIDMYFFRLLDGRAQFLCSNVCSPQSWVILIGYRQDSYVFLGIFNSVTALTAVWAMLDLS